MAKLHEHAGERNHHSHFHSSLAVYIGWSTVLARQIRSTSQNLALLARYAASDMLGLTALVLHALHVSSHTLSQVVHPLVALRALAVETMVASEAPGKGLAILMMTSLTTLSSTSAGSCWYVLPYLSSGQFSRPAYSICIHDIVWHGHSLLSHHQLQ